MSGGRWGYRVGNAELYNSMLRDGLNGAPTSIPDGTPRIS
jgi:hypothetical protein